jgi:hypothetical protein
MVALGSWQSLDVPDLEDVFHCFIHDTMSGYKKIYHHTYGRC